jgi:hypothetical protein
MDEENKNKEIDNIDEVVRLTEDTETLENIFSGPTNLLKDLYDSFEDESYTVTLANSKKMLAIMEQPTQEFMKMGMALSISAASRWVSTLGEVGVDIQKVEELISKAKEHFSSNDFLKADETIDEVRAMIAELEEEQKEAAEKRISTAETIIEEGKNIGASVNGAERTLLQAKELFEKGDYSQVANLTNEAKEAAENAKEQRIQTTSDALLFTRSVIDESKDMGVNTNESDELYKEAKKAFAKGDYQKCSELNKEAEEMALKLQDEHIEKVLSLKEKRAAMMKSRTEMEAAKPSEDEAETEAQEELCPWCDSSTRYVEKYDRYWCRNCRKYTPRK